MRYIYFNNSVIFLLFSFSLSAAELTVHVTGIDKTAGGNIMIGIFESEATFLQEEGSIIQASIPVSQAEEGLVMTKFELPLGKTYAIAAYHDANGNEKLDKNFFGMPQEGYGFSNNARSTFGPPTFEKAAFKLMLEKGQFVSFYLSY
jgi:uncharacterized protein (DUF2141 family)